jgi:hypothetical protein
MSVHDIDNSRIKRIPREDIERSKDEDRSIEINQMRLLMRRYPDKAKEVAVEMFRIRFTEKAA